MVHVNIFISPSGFIENPSKPSIYLQALLPKQVYIAQITAR